MRLQKTIISTFLILSFALQAFTQPPTNDQLNKLIQDQLKLIEQQKSDIDDLKKQIGTSQPADPSLKEILLKQSEQLKQWEIAKISGGRNLEWYEYVLFLIPLILSIGLFFIYVKRDWFKDAVTDPDKPKTVTINKTNFKKVLTLVDGKNIETQVPDSTEITTIDSHGKSASRMVLFFSSFLSIILALSFSTVFLYGYLRGNAVPDFSALVKVLLSLGIGVIPYTINQFTKPENDNPAVKPGA